MASREGENSRDARDRAEGGYGDVRRVRIAKMAGIPTNCDFAAKKSKAATPLFQ